MVLSTGRLKISWSSFTGYFARSGFIHCDSESVCLLEGELFMWQAFAVDTALKVVWTGGRRPIRGAVG